MKHFKFALLLILLLCLICVPAQAEMPTCLPPSYTGNGCDPFNLWNSDHALHVLGSTLMVIGIDRILVKYAGVPKWTAVFIAATSTYILFTQKEFFYDKFPSDGNNRGNLYGAGAGAILVIVLF